MTRELKLALIVGFSLVLAVTVLISDHLSKARQLKLAEVSSAKPQLAPALVVEPPPNLTAESPIPLPPSADQTQARGTQPAPVPGTVTGTPNPTGSADPVEPHPAAPKYAAQPRPVEPAPDIVHVSQGTGRTAIPAPTLKPEVRLDPDSDILRTAEALGHTVVKRAGMTEIVPGVPTPTPNAQNPTVVSTGTRAPKPASAESEQTYTVVDGDSFSKIAKKVYGDATRWKSLAAANADRVKGDNLKIGTKLRVPGLSGAASAATPRLAESTPAKPTTGSAKPETKPDLKANAKPDTATKPAPRKAEKPAADQRPRYASYTVRKGDTLNGIAKRLLGSAARAGEVAKLNAETVDDIDNIPIGTVLKLPQS